MAAFATPWAALEAAYRRELMKLFRKFLPANVSRASLRAVSNSPGFQRAAENVIRRMVGRIQNVNARSWREAAFKSGRSREIYLALRQELSQTSTRRAIRSIITENAKLIRSIPIDLAKRVTRYTEEAQERGLRAEQVEKDLRRKLGHLGSAKIKLIARTEISKAETAITRVRAEQLGINWYQWLTSEDERVRPSHKNMEGVLVNWDDPPSPENLIGERSTLGHYHAGCAPNCRCPALPLISLNEVSWPARVYSNGSVSRMTRIQFQRLMPRPIAA